MVLYMSNISCILQMWTAWIYVKSIITIKVCTQLSHPKVSSYYVAVPAMAPFTYR